MDQRQQIARLHEQIEKLKQEAKTLAADNEQLKQEKRKLSEKLLKSQNELEALIRRIFGRKSERFEDEDQLKSSWPVKTSSKSHPESVRDYRIDEKRERGARRDRQRLERRLAKLSR